ncbi:unnamed protein product [Brassica oleracea]
MLMKRICATIQFLTRRDKRNQNLFPTEVKASAVGYR